LISRHHCAILIDNDVVAVRDFNSRNGTFVNGEKVVGQTALKTGDKLSVGQLLFEVHASHGESVARRPKGKDMREPAAGVAAPAQRNAGQRDAAQRDGAERDATRRDEDTDVTQWLMEDTSVTAAADTKASDLSKTQQFAPEESSGPLDVPDLSDAAKSAPAAKAAAVATSDSKAGVSGKKTPGKLPVIPAVATKDSREAAAEMLKKILRNR
jgi:pSer/pThr/pTyr-binding forkhead associated (FHA) protein